MIPDYSILSNYLNNYEEQINAIYHFKSELFLQNRKSVAHTELAKKQPKHHYFICFINRSGSTLLSHVLTRTNKMGKVGEMFNPEPIANICQKNGLTSMAEYIDWQIQTTSQSSGVFGTKIGMHQLAYLAKHGYLADKFPDAKFVYVTRQDMVMQAISLYIASHTGEWTSRAVKTEQSIEFDYEAIATRLKSIATTQAEFEAFFASHGIEPLRLTYEGIEENLTRSMRRVCKFVGIERPGQILLPDIILEKQRTEQNDEWAKRFRDLHIKQITAGQTGKNLNPPSQLNKESPVSTLKLSQSEREWLEYFRENYLKPLTSEKPNQAKPELELPQQWQPIQRALRQKNVELLEKQLRQLELTADPDLISHPKVAIAKRWLSARAIAMNNIALAREMYQPFTMNMPLNQALVLPDLTESELIYIVQRYPDWLEMTLVLAYFYWQRRNFNKTSKILHDVMQNFTDTIIYHTIAEYYCDSLVRLKDEKSLVIVENFCEKLTHSSQTYRYPFLYLGSVIFQRCSAIPTATDLKKTIQRIFQPAPIKRSDDNLEKAIHLFNEAKKRPEGLISFSSGCNSVIDPRDVPLLPNDLSEQLSSDVIPDLYNTYQTNGKTVLFFACDGIYFCKYAFLLIASVARLNQYTVCHAHIVNPEEDSAETILKIRRQFTTVQFNVSIEHFYSSHAKAYYASVRFIRAEQLLALYQSPLLITDVDTFLEVSMEYFSQFVGNNDIGYCGTQKATAPWTKILAGVIYLNNTAKVQKFLQLLSAAILSKLLNESEQSLWFVDQNALFSVIHFMDKQLSVCNLDESKQKTYNHAAHCQKHEFTKMKLAELGFENNT